MQDDFFPQKFFDIYGLILRFDVPYFVSIFCFFALYYVLFFGEWNEEILGKFI